MNKIIKGIMFSILACFLALQTWAQDDKKIDVDINVDKGNNDWYQQPWVWIVGAAVFIIIIVALMRGSGKKE